MTIKQLRKVLDEFDDDRQVFIAKFLDEDRVDIIQIQGAADNAGDLQLENYESEKAQERVFLVRAELQRKLEEQKAKV